MNHLKHLSFSASNTFLSSSSKAKRSHWKLLFKKVFFFFLIFIIINFIKIINLLLLDWSYLSPGITFAQFQFAFWFCLVYIHSKFDLTFHFGFRLELTFESRWQSVDLFSSLLCCILVSKQVSSHNHHTSKETIRFWMTKLILITTNCKMASFKMTMTLIIWSRNYRWLNRIATNVQLSCHQVSYSKNSNS